MLTTPMPFELEDAIRAAGGGAPLTLEQLEELLGGDDELEVAIRVRGGRVTAVECLGALNVFIVAYSDGLEESFCYPATRPACAAPLSLPDTGAFERYLSSLRPSATQRESSAMGGLTYDEYVALYGPMVTVLRVAQGRVVAIQSCANQSYSFEYADGTAEEVS